MPAGRPSVYDDSFCHVVVSLGKEGKTRTQFAAHFDVCKQTLTNWGNEHPEFLAAMERAAVHSQACWEQYGQDGLTAERFSAGVYSRSMAARFPADWREKSEQDVNHSGTVAVPLDVTGVSVKTLREIARLKIGK